MSIFELVNQISADEVLAAINLPLANDRKSYVCPDCGNGTHGRKGDGIKPTLYHGQLTWHCYSCGKHFSNSDLIATVNGVDLADSAAVARCLAEVFPQYSAKDFSPSREKPQRPAQPTSEQPARKDNSADYVKWQGDLPGFMSKVGGKWRGLTTATLTEAGAGYNDRYGSIILPYDKSTYFWRAIYKRADGKPIKGINKGGKRQMYIALGLKTGGSAINFLTEGEIDALSIKQAIPENYRDMFGVAATGSASFVRLTVEQLNKKFGTSQTKPRFIFVADNDKSGIEGARKFVDALNAAGYPTVELFFAQQKGNWTRQIVGREDSPPPEEFEVPKVDANDFLQEHSEAELFNRLAYGEEVLKLERLAEELAREKRKAEVEEAELTQREKALADKAREEKNLSAVASDAQDFPLKEYFAGGQFDAEVERVAEYAGRLTGFDNLDSEQIFLPGLYVLGGTPGAGKTTFAWQLLEQMARQGETAIFGSYEMSVLELATKTIARGLRRKYFAMSEKMTDSAKKKALESALCLPSAQIRLRAHEKNFYTAPATDKRKKLAEVVSALRDEIPEGLRIWELSSMTVEELVAKVKDFAAKNYSGGKLTLAIDYLQLVPVKNDKASTKERVDSVMLALKTLQRELGATIILISSLNRAAYGEQKKLSVFKESGAIEYSADVTWALSYNDENKILPRYVQLECLKNRNGSPYKVAFDYYAQSDYFCPCKVDERRLEIQKKSDADESDSGKKNKPRNNHANEFIS